MIEANKNELLRGKPFAVLVDADGTLVDVSSIRYLVDGAVRDFDKFHRGSVNCPPNQKVKDLIQALGTLGLFNLLLTGRSEKYRSLTDFWLALNEVEIHDVFMRGSLDTRSDLDLKNTIFERISHTFTPIVAIDDRPELLELWRSKGVAFVYSAVELEGVDTVETLREIRAHLESLTTSGSRE